MQTALAKYVLAKIAHVVPQVIVKTATVADCAKHKSRSYKRFL
ncbi:MAG: hypothetical protein ABIO55_13740 [Ginsengibacter sp.]